MIWDTGDTALQAQVLERQRVTIENYARDPDLLAEHVGMEDNFQTGGYGERQVEELLQNAIDQLAAPGRVELRIADGVLYCANEGSPFGADGIKAVTGAFLSAKKDEKIGRFGLGFKSVLGVTDRPQILSRSVSFGFNSPEAKALLSNLPYQPARVPTLRVPSVLNAAELAQEDPNVAEMMEWATTIVRLPLVRGGARLVERLRKFDVRYLLFPERLSEVRITLEGSEPRDFRRTTGAGPDLVTLEAPGAEPTAWRVLHRKHSVSPKVRESLPWLFDRDKVRVSYALPVGPGRREDGEFWAWFPLRDRTTAQGIFNAPWQVNDDRTSMLPSSHLNQELLGVATELLIEAALLESTAGDPAKHFDVLPARGREVRSNADRYMSEQVPKLARRHELIPTAAGEMRAPSRVRVPYVKLDDGQKAFGLPAPVIRLWSEATGSSDTPHWSCYTSPTRRARLTQLLTDEGDRVAAKTIEPSAWLSEVARPRTLPAVDAALAIYLELKAEKERIWSQFSGAQLIPTDDTKFARVSEAPTVLLPVDGIGRPDRVRLVDPKFASHAGIRDKLRRLGVKEISRDQVVAAIAAQATSTWDVVDWKHLWAALARASPNAGTEALHAIRARNLVVLVPTKAGQWRTASEVFRDPSSVPGVPSRQLDHSQIGGRSDLLGAAGCVDDLTIENPVIEGKVFAAYRAAMLRDLNKRASKIYQQHVTGSLRLGRRRGVRPLDILLELNDSTDPAAPAALARWTARVLELMPSKKVSVSFTLSNGANASAEVQSPEVWCIERIGLLSSSLGFVHLDELLASSLSAYGRLLPVATRTFAGQYSLTADIVHAPTNALRIFLERDGYELADRDKLAEVLAVAASRNASAKQDQLPAIDPRTGLVQLTPIPGIVIADADELDDLKSHSLRYIPSTEWDTILTEAWSIPTASDVIAKAIDWNASGDAVPILDIYPTLRRAVDSDLEDTLLRRCSSIVRRTTSPSGVQEHPLSGHLDLRTVLVVDELDGIAALLEASKLLRLRLSRSDAEGILRQDDALRKSRFVQRVQAEQTESGKLLKLAGRPELAAKLPQGLLDIIEQRQGRRSDQQVAQLFLNTYGNDSLRRLRDTINAAGLPVPRAWDGTSESEQFVTNLGFPRAFAGTREKKNPPIEIVPGRIDLKPLHPFQQDLLRQIRELALIRDKDGEHRRGLLYLPTGAGKTRVTTEAIATMLRDDELASPVLWIAQSEELCEQAIVSWAEVWRAIGDERPLEITRYWGKYESDESLQELQVVVATDAKLEAMIDSTANAQAHRWLQNAKLVVIDEAHRAGGPRYVKILRWLGITQGTGSHTDRPLLGLTATPYRGTNEEINRLFALRFGERRLNALDDEDPIGQLRTMCVLSNVEHQLLDGVEVHDAPTDGKGGARAWDDVSRGILEKLGQNLDRTQLLVDHIMRQSDEWPILVFTPSVVSAHVTAALIRSLGREADAVDGEMRGQERRQKIDSFKNGSTQVLVNCDLLAQGFDAPKVRALYIARPTFSPNRYVQMVGRGLRGPLNGGTENCLLVNMVDTFTQFDRSLAYTEFDFLWTKKGAKSK